MFGVIRILLIFLLSLIAFFIILRFSKNHPKRMFRIIAVVVLLSALLVFIPFENLVYNFKSAEEVYEYYYFSEEKVEMVVEGEQSDFVIGKKNGTRTFLIVPKTSDGWRIGISLNTKKVAHKFFNGFIVNVYQYKNINDYFVTVSYIKGGELSVSDYYNTKFYSLKDGFLGKNFVTYYAHITNLNPQYSVIVNDNKIVLEKTGDGSLEKIGSNQGTQGTVL